MRQADRPSRRYRPLALAALVWVALALPPLRGMLEASMIMHMLVQLPMLAAAGALAAWSLRPAWRSTPWHPAWQRCMRGGACGLVFAGFVMTLWMLPRLLDAAVLQADFELAKFVLLPLAGAALVSAWPRCPSLARIVVHVEVIATLLRFGWGYLAAPERLCTVYLLDEQVRAGTLLLAAGALYAASVTLPALFGPLPWSRLTLLRSRSPGHV